MPTAVENITQVPPEPSVVGFGKNVFGAKEAAPAAPAPADAQTSKPNAPAPPEKPDAAMSEGARKNFEALQKKHADEVTAWEKKYTDSLKLAESLKATEQERDTFKTTLSQRESQLKALAFERSPEFKEKYDSPIVAAVQSATDNAGDKGEELGRLLSMEKSKTRTAKIAELLSDLPHFQQASIATNVMELDRLRDSRKAEAEKVNSNWDAFEKSRHEEMSRIQESSRKRLVETVDATFENLTGPNGTPLFQKRDGDDAHNRAVEADIQAAKQCFTGNIAHSDMAKIVANGIASKRLAAQNVSLLTELKKAQDHIASLEAAGAKIGNLNGHGEQPKAEGIAALSAGVFTRR